MVAATELPVNADFESGFAADPDGVAESVRMAIETGVAGLSIEDSTGDPDDPLRDLAIAVARMRAARAAIDEAGGDTLLVGRAENFLVGRPDLDDTHRAPEGVRRGRRRLPLCARASALASRSRRWWPRSRRSRSTCWSDRSASSPLEDIAALGVRRVSVGGALARAAWGGFLRAARTLAEEGRFDGLADAPTGRCLNAAFGTASGPHPDP